MPFKKVEGFEISKVPPSRKIITSVYYSSLDILKLL